MNKIDPVAKFFNSISSRYVRKYDPTDSPFLSHFFRERLLIAANNIPADANVLLDIGSGAGTLYSVLKESALLPREFWAVDISEGMLACSPVDDSHKVQGTVHSNQLDPLKDSCDCIVMLGVTTYMSRESLVECFDRVQELASEKCVMICTFTNSQSIESFIQWLLGYFMSSLRPLVPRLNTFVSSQNFKRLTLSEHEMRDLVGKLGKVNRRVYLNQTLTPFNRIFPVASRKVGELLCKLFERYDWLMRLASSDILWVVDLDVVPAISREPQKNYGL